jgi:hypothetical protein
MYILINLVVFRIVRKMKKIHQKMKMKIQIHTGGGWGGGSTKWFRTISIFLDMFILCVQQMKMKIRIFVATT